MKQIYLEVLLNGNDEGRVINLVDNEAEALIALFDEAKETVLKDVDEEDWYTVFDPWLKAKCPELYSKAITQWQESFSEGLNEEVGPESIADASKFMSVVRDAEGLALADDNEIYISGVAYK